VLTIWIPLLHINQNAGKNKRRCVFDGGRGVHRHPLPSFHKRIPAFPCEFLPFA